MSSSKRKPIPPVAFAKALRETAAVARNAWIKDGPLSVYIRKSERMFVLGKRVHTIDVANVTVRTPGQGLFTLYLHGVECLAATRGSVVYVENVIDERFREFFRRRGYTECEGGFGTRSFYLERK